MSRIVNWLGETLASTWTKTVLSIIGFSTTDNHCENLLIHMYILVRTLKLTYLSI